MTDQNFPLLTLQPALGPGQKWIGVRILGADAADGAALRRVFEEFGLADASAGLTCLLPPDALARLSATDLPSGCVVASAADLPVFDAQPPVACKGPTQALLLKILAQTTSDAETREIEATLKMDPQLSVQLLRLVNSVAFAPSARINSFAHAITMLGRRQLQRWLQLLLYASQSADAGGSPLMAGAAFRASLMEGLCKALRSDKATQDEAFMVGMFSRLEDLFGQPLASIIEPLKLVEEVNAALLQHRGKLGELLALVEAADRNPQDVAPRLARLAVNHEAWCKAQVDALRWTLQVSRET